MDRSPSLPPRAHLAVSRLKWLWLVVAGVLGVWLLALLAISDDDKGKGPPEMEKLPRGAMPAPKKPQYGTGAAFTKRPEFRAVRPSPPVPLRVDPAESE